MATQLVPMARYTFLKSLSEADVDAIQWDAEEFECEADNA